MAGPSIRRPSRGLGGIPCHDLKGQATTAGTAQSKPNATRRLADQSTHGRARLLSPSNAQWLLFARCDGLAALAFAALGRLLAIT
jgi:hypothetical protein